jgi:hypothetical protein
MGAPAEPTSACRPLSQASRTAELVSGATLDEHEGDTIHDHQFVNVLSPSCPSEVA